MKNLKLLINIIIYLVLASNISAHDHSTLPLEVVKCGTFLPEKKKKKVMDELMGDYDPRYSGMQAYYDSPGGCFRIHYDLINTDTIKNAVDPTDNNSNGIPDYVDSAAYYADFAYDYYVEQLGYFPPCPDNGEGGSEKYDIYLVNLGEGKVGSTFYGFTLEAGTIYPNRKFERWYSYLIVDNNFSPYDSTSLGDGQKVQTYKTFYIDALKITLVHELHHAIQFKYGESLPPVHMMNELTSTYYESEIFPEITDYFQYVRNLFRNFEDAAFGNGNFENGYAWSIFGQFMNKEYDPLLIKRVWELIYEGIPTYSALDSAFRENGTTLQDAWCEFLPWLYYTGERAQGKAYFNDAALFPEMIFYREDNFSAPSFSDNSTLEPFEVRGFRCYFPSDDDFATDDTLDFILTNTDLNAAITQSLRQSEYTFVIADNEIPDAMLIENTDYYYKLDAERSTFCYSHFYNSGIATDKISSSFPNPFRPGIDEAIFFPAPQNAQIYDEVNVKIYSSGMLQLHSMKLPVSIRNSYRVLNWESVPSDLETGVYIYYLEYNGSGEFGKFAIIK